VTELRKRIEEGAKWMPGFGDKPIPPRLPTLARFIRETWPELDVKLEPWTTNTDRKIPGSRLRIPGRGRKGNLLTVRELEHCARGHRIERLLLRHESGETYRHNGEVCDWIMRRLRSHPPKKT